MFLVFSDVDMCEYSWCYEVSAIAGAFFHFLASWPSRQLSLVRIAADLFGLGPTIMQFDSLV